MISGLLLEYTHVHVYTRVDPCTCTYAHTQNTKLLYSLTSAPFILFNKSFSTSALERALSRWVKSRRLHFSLLLCPSCRLLKTGIFFWAAGKSAWGREKTPWSTEWPPCSSGWRLKKWDQQCGGGKRKHQAALKETEGSGGKTSNCSHPERKTCWCWYRLCVQVPFLVLSDRWLYPLGSLSQQWTQLNSLH